MKVYENGTLRPMTLEEIENIKTFPREPREKDPIEVLTKAVKILMEGKTLSSNEDKIECNALYPEWSPGKHTKGEVYTTPGQIWECFQDYDNAVYPGLIPTDSSWYTFNRPLHGKSVDTARYFVQPMGAHDMYHAGEFVIYFGELYKCIQDTAYSPKDYAAAWKNWYSRD